MDRKLELAHMWREFNDEWYRLQTNSPYVIKKLNKRLARTDKVKTCGKTIPGSTESWMLFRVRYKKPSTAKQSFIRLTNCKSKYTSENGVITAEIVHKRGIKDGGVV